MKKYNLTEEDRSKLREYFRNYAALQIHESGYYFDDKVKHWAICVQRKEDFAYLKKDQLMLAIGTERGLLNLSVGHKLLLQLKRELYTYEGYWLGKDPSVINREISSEEMKWKFGSKEAQK